MPEFIFVPVSRHVITTRMTGRKWDIHELSDFVLPPLPSWYRAWKSFKGTGKRRIFTGNALTLSAKYIRLVELLQKEGYCEGYRETLCFMYWNFALTGGMTADEAKKSTLAFNRRFSVPLREKEVLSHARPRKTYKYRLRTLVERLGISEDILRQAGFTGFDKKAYNRAYMKNRRAAKAVRSNRKDLIRMVQKLKNQGCRLADICSQTKLSLATVKRYLKIKLIDLRCCIKKPSVAKVKHHTPYIINFTYDSSEAGFPACFSTG